MQRIVSANRVICVSGSTKGVLLRFMDIDLKKVRVIYYGYYGVDHELFRFRDKLEARPKLHLPLDRPMVLSAGSDEVYGDILQGSFTEEDRLRPSSPYAATKAAADLLCLAYHRTYGLDAIITRCTNNFGPYQFPEKLIPKTIIRAHLNMKVPIYGTGKNVRDWIYVLDHCEALDLVAQRGRAGEIYNISSGNELTNLEVVQRILEIMGKPEGLIEFVEDRPGHDVRYSLDSSKIRNELGWRPKYEFEEALAETIEWYLKNKWWWSSLADERVLHPKPWTLKW